TSVAATANPIAGYAQAGDNRPILVELFRPIINRRRHQINDGGGRRRRDNGLFETLEARQLLSAAKVDWRTLPPQVPPPATVINPQVQPGTGQVVTIPALPGLKARAIGSHRVSLEWPAFIDASSYQIR